MKAFVRASPRTPPGRRPGPAREPAPWTPVILLPFMVIGLLVMAPSSRAAANSDPMNASSQLRSAWVKMDEAAHFERRQAWDQAGELLRQARDQLEKSVSQKHPLYLAAVLRAARMELRRGEYSTARTGYLLAQKLVEQSSQPHSLFMAEILQGLAEASPAIKMPPKSPPIPPIPTELRDQAAAIHVARFDAPLPGKGEAWFWAGEIAQEEGRADAALRDHTQALRVFMKTPGPFHAKRVEIMLKLASLYDTRGMPEPAADLLKSALAITENMWGTDHPAVAPILERLATNLLAQKKSRQGQSHVARLLTITRLTWGVDHLRTIRASILMANYLLADLDLEQALQILRNLQEHLETPSIIHGAELSMVMASLAEAERIRNRPDIAEQFHQRALALRAKYPVAPHLESQTTSAAPTDKETEPVQDGVAAPPTPAPLIHIQAPHPKPSP
ncbi:MAG: tetratricopeptide repeat protein [Magnetococcales bacterium]|nr:tetratricopeptide repeat protein [Magnetococcales bacterium]